MEGIAKRYTAFYIWGGVLMVIRLAGTRKGLFGAVETGPAIGPDSTADAAFPCPGAIPIREYGMQGGLLLDVLALRDGLIHAASVLVALNTIRSNQVLAIPS